MFSLGNKPNVYYSRRIEITPSFWWLHQGGVSTLVQDEKVIVSSQHYHTSSERIKFRAVEPLSFAHQKPRSVRTQVGSHTITADSRYVCILPSNLRKNRKLDCNYRQAFSIRYGCCKCWCCLDSKQVVILTWNLMKPPKPSRQQTVN